MINMPVITNVICLSCGAADVANWGDYGADQPCLSCDAPAIDLIKAVN